MRDQIIAGIVSALVIALSAGAWKVFHDWKDTCKIIVFLKDSKETTDFKFRSNNAIASDTNLSEERVRKLCSKSKKIRRRPKINRNSEQSGKKQVDIITMEGCHWCTKLKQEVGKLTKELHEYNINVHRHDSAAAKKFNSTAFPATYVDGNQELVIRGFLPSDKMAAKIRSM